MEPVNLSPCFRALLDRIRQHPEEQFAIDDIDPDLAQQAVEEIGKPVFTSRPMTMVERSAGRWFLAELARVLREHDGWDLAFELELLVRKWVKYGLPSGLAQDLACACYTSLILPTKEPDHVEA